MNPIKILRLVLVISLVALELTACSPMRQHRGNNHRRHGGRVRSGRRERSYGGGIGSRHRYNSAVVGGRGPSGPTVTVNVHKHVYQMYPGDSIRVKCKARGGAKDAQVPIIDFYMLPTPNSSMHLSASFFGIRVEPMLVRKPTNHTKTGKLLHIQPEFYDILSPGENHFYCKAHDINGNKDKSEFTIWKMT